MILTSRLCDIYKPDSGKPTQSINGSAHPMPQLEIETVQVLRALESLNPYRGVGLDSIP